MSLIPVRHGPSNPLLAATAMTSGKRQLKDRIARIATHRRTVALASAAALILALAVGACTFTGADKTGAANTDRPLTGAELKYFNEEYFNSVVLSNYINPHNYFISSLFEKPEDIDLYQLFYLKLPEKFGGFTSPSDEENKLAFDMPTAEMPCASYKLAPADMDAFLTEYTGLTLEETSKKGLDGFIYLPEYDAYYWAHGDTNYRRLDIRSGERAGDEIHLYYENSWYGDPDYAGFACLTLKEVEGGYRFVSNQPSEKPTILTPLPNEDPVLTIPLDSLAPYAAPTLTVTRHTGDYAKDSQPDAWGQGIDDLYICRYRSTDGNLYAAVVYEEPGKPWVADCFLTLPDNGDVSRIDAFSDFFGHEGVVVSYPGTHEDRGDTTFHDYIYFTADGAPTLLAQVYGEAQILDLNGDGVDELVGDDQIFYQQDDKVYEADLRALLQGAWPELTWWDSSTLDPYGKHMIVGGMRAAPGRDKFDTQFTRYLYFDGKSILVYKGGQTANNILEGVAAPNEVLFVTKEMASTAYEAIKAGAPDTLMDQNFDDWRVGSLDRVDLQMYGVKQPRRDIEVYSTYYEFHSSTPQSVICAGGSSVDEDGWYSGFYVRESPYLVFQVKDGTRVPLESALPGWDCTALEFQRGFLQTLIQNNLISPGDPTVLPGDYAQSVLMPRPQAAAWR